MTNKNIIYRVLSVLMTLIMLLQSVPVAFAENATDTIFTEIHDQLIEIPPSDDLLLEWSELAPKTIACIDHPLSLAEASEEIRDPHTPPEQEPAENDGVTIENVYLRWLSSSNGEEDSAGFGELLLTPDGEKVSNQQFQLDFKLSSQEVYEPGDVEIVFPAYLWLDRNGNEYGTLTLSVPENPELGSEFAWKRVEDKIIITNIKTLAPSSRIMLQGTFRNMLSYEVKGETDSQPFYATVNVTTPNDQEVSMEIKANIDTFIKVSSSFKSAYDKITNTYDVWWEDIPPDIPEELLPESPENYGYVRWYVAGSANGSQPFSMYIEDEIIPEYEGIMLGVSHCIEDPEYLGNQLSSSGVYYRKSDDQATVKALLYDGYSLTSKTVYVWTAYPKDKVPQNTKDIEKNVFSLHNEVHISVVGKDDKIESEDSASAEVKTKLPTHYTFYKY